MAGPVKPPSDSPRTVLPRLIPAKVNACRSAPVPSSSTLTVAGPSPHEAPGCVDPSITTGPLMNPKVLGSVSRIVQTPSLSQPRSDAGMANVMVWRNASPLAASRASASEPAPLAAVVRTVSTSAAKGRHCENSLVSPSASVAVAVSTCPPGRPSATSVRV